jgi:uncharacterized YigZ family protein
MYIIKQSFEFEELINKSRFISVVFPLTNIDQLHNTIKDIKKRFPKANHYCYAYVLEDGLNQGSNDDGEPSGTAGLPMLEILRKSKLVNVGAVVIRYFGGIMLGAGGLIRAYSGVLNNCLNTQAIIYEICQAPIYQLSFGYHLITEIEQKLNQQVIYLDKQYLDQVVYQVALLENEQVLTDLKHLFSDFTALGVHTFHKIK